MDADEIGTRLIGCALIVHRALGPGLLESVYETCLAHELHKAGLRFERQRPLPVFYDGLSFETGYRLDLLVEKIIVVEIKTVEQVLDVHKAQLLSYLRLGNFPLGYLLNFHSTLLRQGIVRLINTR
jgi:GxxExxY protein